MKTLNFQKYIRGNSALMKRLMMATKGCGQLTSNDTYFADICFSGVSKADEAMAEVVDYCKSWKTIHKRFCIATFEKSMKDWSGGSYIFLKINPRVPGSIPLMVI